MHEQVLRPTPSVPDLLCPVRFSQYSRPQFFHLLKHLRDRQRRYPLRVSRNSDFLTGRSPDLFVRIRPKNQARQPDGCREVRNA